MKRLKEVSEENNNLIISGNENHEEKSVTFDISNFTIPLFWRYFQSAYRAGCDEIKIMFDPSQKEYEDAFHYYISHFEDDKWGERIPPKTALSMIQAVVDRFLNMAIISSGKDFCIVKEMGEPTMKEFDNSLRRVFIVIFQMFDRIIEAIQENNIGDKNVSKELNIIDLNVDRFVDYCCRIMSKIKTSFPDNKKTLLFSTLFILELIGDELKYVGKNISLSKKPLNDVLELVEMIREHFNIYYGLFYKFSREDSIKLGKSDFNIYGKYVEIKKDLEEESDSIANHIMMTGKLILSLSEIKIEMEFNK